MGLFDDVDMGIVAPTAALGIGAKLLKSIVKQQNVNRYAQTLNQGLPQGYQVKPQQGTFFWGDDVAYKDALKSAAARQYDNWNASYYAEQGHLPQGPLSAIKDVYNTVAGPMQLAKQKQGLEYEEGRKALEAYQWWLSQQQGPTQQAPSPELPPLNPPQSAGVPVGGGVMWDPMPQAPQPGQLMQAGASYSDLPSIPGGVQLSPETARNLFNNSTTIRGQDIRSADTRRGQDLTRQTAKERLDETKRMNSARIQNMMARLGLDRQRVALYAKSLQQRSGRAPTKVEIAQAMLKNGEINQEQFRNFILGSGDSSQLMDFLNGSSAPAGGDAESEADAYLNGD